MKTSFWLAVLAYLVPTFPLGYFWHLVTFHDAYGRLAVYRSDVIIPFGLAAMLIQAMIFAWAYPRLFSTRREDCWRSALRAAGVFAALSWTFSTLAVAAKHRMTSVPDYFLLESAFTLLQFAVVCPLMALAYRGWQAPALNTLDRERARAA